MPKPIGSSGGTQSLWMKTTDVPAFPALAQDSEADVCIIGAGIAGLTCAYFLTKEGRSVIVLDDGPIVSGETQRTTAHLTNAIDDRYTEIERIHGKNGAKLAAESHTAAIQAIERIIQKEKIDCDFKRIDGYLFLGEGQDPDMLGKELEAARNAGVPGVQQLPRAPLPDFDTGICLNFPQQGQFHPLKYLAALAQIITSRGGKIFAHTHASSIEEDAQPVIVHTSLKTKVRASHLIVATNAPVNDNAAIYSKQAPYRTFVIGLRIPKDSTPYGLYWDTIDPYHYVRLQPDADKRYDILIVGGEDHKSGEANDMPLRLHRLEQWTRKRFPAAQEKVYEWSGQVMETIDGVAMIGRKPGGKDWSYIVTGDSGMGMTHGTIAGLLLTDLIQLRDNPWAHLYNPGRFRLHSATEFLKENVHVGTALVNDWIAKSDIKDPKNLTPGSGALIRKGASKIALYRDDAGEFHAYSAVCPHKGCIVQWNGGEKSWDCPCHGSRYDTDGRVLNGPTIKGMEQIKDWDI